MREREREREKQKDKQKEMGEEKRIKSNRRKRYIHENDRRK